MGNKNISREGYNKLFRLVEILKKKFKDERGMDYFDAKDAMTRYDSVLKTYNIQGIDLSKIDKADIQDIEKVIKELDEKLDPQKANSPKEKADNIKQEYDDILNKMDTKKSGQIKRYIHLVEKEKNGEKLSPIEENEKTRIKYAYCNDQEVKNALRKYKDLTDAEKDVSDIEIVKDNLKNKLGAKEAIDGYDPQKLQELEKYYDILIDHPEYKKSILDIRDMKLKEISQIAKDIINKNYGDKYEKDKDAKNFDDLSDDLKVKLQNEKSTYFDKDGKVIDENIFKGKIDEIAKSEKEDEGKAKEQQYNDLSDQIDKYTTSQNKTEQKFRDEIDQELKDRNATFSDEDLVLKDYYEKIVAFEEKITEKSNEVTKINQEISNLEHMRDPNGNLKPEITVQIADKQEKIDEINEEVNGILKDIAETKDEMYQQQAFVNKIIDEKEELENELHAEESKEQQELQEISNDIDAIFGTIPRPINGQIFLSIAGRTLSKYLNSSYLNNFLMVDETTIDNEMNRLKSEAENAFEPTRKSVEIQEKIKNLDTFIGGRTKKDLQGKTSQSQNQQTGPIPTGSTMSGQNRSDPQQTQTMDPNNTQSYTSQATGNGPTRVNPTGQRPKDVADDKTDLAKEGRFSKFRKGVAKTFNNIKNMVKNKYHDFKNRKNNNEGPEQTQQQPQPGNTNNNQPNPKPTSQPQGKQSNSKDDVQKAIDEYNQTEKQIIENMKTQKDIDKFLEDNFKDIEDGKYSPTNNGRGSQGRTR